MIRAVPLLTGLLAALALAAGPAGSAPAQTGAQGCADISLVPFQTRIDFEAAIQPLFDQRCVICHAVGSEFLDLSAGRSAASLIDRSSQQDPARWLVRPGEPEASLLVAKLLCSDPGLGGPMPPGQSISLFQQAVIHDWILGGAPTVHEDRLSRANFRAR